MLMCACIPHTHVHAHVASAYVRPTYSLVTYVVHAFSDWQIFTWQISCSHILPLVLKLSVKIEGKNGKMLAFFC